MDESQSIDNLLRDLEHRSPHIRQKAAKSVGQLETLPQDQKAEVLKLLLILVEEKNKYLRMTAASALVSQRLDASRGLQILCELLKDSHRDIRAAAAIELGNLGKSAHPASAALKVALNDENESVRKAVEATLTKLGLD